MSAGYCRALLALAAWLLVVGSAGAETAPDEEVRRPEIAHVETWLGAVDTDETWTLEDENDGDSLPGDIGTLPYVGGAGSRMWGGWFRYGFEGGGLIAWKNDGTRFFGTGNSLRVEIDNQFLSFEVFMGGRLSMALAPGLRLFVAAGPSLAWARLKNEDEEAEVSPSATNSGGTSIFIDLNEEEDDFSARLYARGGLEFEFANGFTIGASARYADHRFDFGSSGKVKLDEVQWFLTLGSRI
jgi:hypothetical protein